MSENEKDRSRLQAQVAEVKTQERPEATVEQPELSQREKERKIGRAYNELIQLLVSDVPLEEKKQKVFEMVQALPIESSLGLHMFEQVNKELEKSEAAIIHEGTDPESKLKVLMDIIGLDDDTKEKAPKVFYEIKQYYTGLYGITLDQKVARQAFSKRGLTAQAVAFTRKQATILMVQEGYFLDENLPHELHHGVYWNLRKAGVLPESDEERPEMKSAFYRYQNELVARLVTIDDVTAEHGSKDQEAQEQTSLSSVLLLIAKAAGRKFGYSREDFIFPVMKARNYKELQQGIQDILPLPVHLNYDVLKDLTSDDKGAYMFEEEEMKGALNLFKFEYGDEEIREIREGLLRDSKSKVDLRDNYRAFQKKLGLVGNQLPFTIEDLEKDYTGPEVTSRSPFSR